MIHVYSDCSYKPIRACATVFDTWGQEFLISNFYHTDSSVTAETIASQYALRRVKHLLEIGVDDEFTIYTDCFAIAAFMDESLEMQPHNFQLSTRKIISRVIKEKKELQEQYGVKIHFIYVNRKDSEELRAVDSIAYRYLLGKNLENRKKMSFGRFFELPYYIGYNFV